MSKKKNRYASRVHFPSRATAATPFIARRETPLKKGRLRMSEALAVVSRCNKYMHYIVPRYRTRDSTRSCTSLYYISSESREQAWGVEPANSPWRLKFRPQWKGARYNIYMHKSHRRCLRRCRRGGQRDAIELNESSGFYRCAIYYWHTHGPNRMETHKLEERTASCANLLLCVYVLS